MNTRDRYPVLAMGLCTPLGLDLATNLYQIHADATPFAVLDEHDDVASRAPVLAPLKLLKDVPRRAERMHALLLTALDECLIRGATRLIRDTAVPVWVAIPKDTSDAEKARLAEAVDEVARHHGVTLGTPVWIAEGRAAYPMALDSARSHLDSDRNAIAFVAAVDSNCDTETVQRLREAGRLMAEEGSGIIPGEGGGCLLLGHPAALSADTPGIGAIAQSLEPQPFASGEVGTARGMTEVLAGLMATDSEKRRADRLFFCGSGDPWFVRELNHAYLRQPELVPEPLDVYDLAQQMGDTGATSPLIQIAYAAFWMRQQTSRSPARRALITASADHGAVTGLLLDLTVSP